MSAPTATTQSNISTTVDQEGNRVQQYTGSGQPGIHTHDQSNDDETNQKLYGSGSQTATYTDPEGNKVEAYVGGGSGPGIRTHDQSDEAAINEKLFGKNAPQPPACT